MELMATTREVTLKGVPYHLVGQPLEVGQSVPKVSLVANDLSVTSLKEFQDKILLIASVPSLDTPVCDMEVRRFNQEAKRLGEHVAAITVSMDLPFAQKRWCVAGSIKGVTTLSDHREASFGTNFGVLIKELRLLARAVFLVDKQRVLRFMHLVPEISEEPNYDQILEEAQSLLKELA